MSEYILGLTEEEERRMANKLRSIYYRADKEVQKKANKYFQRIAKEDKRKAQMVNDGELSREEYIEWRKRRVFEVNSYDEMLDSISHEYLYADTQAYAYVNGKLPMQFVGGYNTTGEAIQHEVAGYSFSMIDQDAVRVLTREDGRMFIATAEKEIEINGKVVDTQKVLHYTDKKARAEITQGIVQGESVDDVAKRLVKVSNVEYSSAQRMARTLMNQAHSQGQFEAQQKAIQDGILLQKQWSATHDARTRDGHADLDGTIVDVDEPFDTPYGSKMMYPRDPHGRPEDVYNCRCTMRDVVNGFFNRFTGKAVKHEDIGAKEYEKKSREYWEAMQK